MDYIFHLLVMIGLYLMLAQSLNLVFGLGRLLNLAHVSFYALGAYSTALLTTLPGDAAWSFFATVPVGIFVSGLLALMVTAIALKLSADYFAVGTLAFSALVSAVLINWKGLTRGVLGVSGIPRPVFLGIDFYSSQNFVLFVWFFVGLTLFLLHRVFNGSISRQLRAQAEYEIAAVSLGSDPKFCRIKAIVLSAAVASIAGSLFASYMRYIDPSSFGLTEMVFVLSLVIVGKPGSFWGNILSTIFLVLLPEPLRHIELKHEYLGPVRQLLYAAVMFSVVWYNRKTLFPSSRTV